MTASRAIGDIGGTYARFAVAERGKYSELQHLSVSFASSPFRERFEDKGRFQDYLRRIPTYLILEESPALLGLANLPLEP